jgi:hypothetical protein
MTFRNNIGPDAVAAATLAPSAFEAGLPPFKLLAAAAAVGSGRAGRANTSSTRPVTTDSGGCCRLKHVVARQNPQCTGIGACSPGASCSAAPQGSGSDSSHP